MKKLILSLLLIGSMLSLSAQHNYFINANYGVGRTIVIHDLSPYSEIDGKSLKLPSSANIEVGSYLGKRDNFYVTLGAGWHQQGRYSEDSGPWNDGSIGHSYILLKWDYLAVNVSAGLTAGWFYAQLNAATSFLLKTKYDEGWYKEGQNTGWNPAMSPEDMDKVTKQWDDLTRHFNIFVGTSMGVKIPVYKNIKLQLGINGMVNVMDAYYNSDGVNTFQASASVQAGIQYNFGKKKSQILITN